MVSVGADCTDNNACTSGEKCQSNGTCGGASNTLQNTSCGSNKYCDGSGTCRCRQKSSSNKLTNPGFDGDATGWLLESGGAYRATPDADGCSGSGSIELSGTGSLLRQCISVGTSAPTHVYYRYRYRNWDFNSSAASSGSSWCFLSYLASGCDPNNVTDSNPGESTFSENGAWVQGGGDAMTSAGTGSVMVTCQAVLGTGYYDQLYLGTAIPPAIGF